MSITHNPNKRTITTPAGTAIFPHLNTPDTKFDDAGVYKTDLAMDAQSPEAQELMALIDEYVDAAQDEQKADMKPAQAKKVEKHRPYFMEEDDEGEETGRVKFRFKANYQFKDNKTGKTQYRDITMFDAKGGSPMKEPPRVGMGSIIKVATKVSNSWYNAQTKSAGVTLYIQAVQVLQVAQMGGNAEGFGFGEEDEYEGVGESEAEANGFQEEDDAADSAGDQEAPAPGEGDF